MKTIIIIPARYASSRFPGKPLAKIGNRTVIQCVVEKASVVTEDIYVATDDRRIFDCVTAFGGKAVMTSEAHRSGTDRCFEAYGKIVRKEGQAYEVVVNLQGDEPFIRPSQIESLVSCFEDPAVQIATLAKKFEQISEVFDPNKVKVVFSAQHTALYFSRSPIPYCRGVEKEKWAEITDFYKHVGMYAYRPAVLERITALPSGRLEKAESLEQLRWLENGYNIAVRLTAYESLGIDTPEDLEKANLWIEKKIKE